MSNFFSYGSVDYQEFKAKCMDPDNMEHSTLSPKSESESTSDLTRLLRIEEELGCEAVYAGEDWRTPASSS